MSRPILLHRFARSLPATTKEPETSTEESHDAPLSTPDFPEATPEPTRIPGPSMGDKAVNSTLELGELGVELAGKALDHSKTALAENKGTQFLSDKTHIPPWAIVTLVSLILILPCLLVFFFTKRKWRQFRRSEKGRELILSWHEHPTFGKYAEKLIQPVQPLPHMTELTEFKEPEVEPAELTEEPVKPGQIGKLHFQLEYDFELQTLAVTVLECVDLPPMHSTGMSDPYVKVFFLGDKKKKFETKVHRKTLNPEYNEMFVYKNVTFDDVMSKWLVFQVFDFDRFSSHDQIGEIRIKLCTIDLMYPYEGWLDWEPPIVEGDDQPLGDICFSLRYNPVNYKLTLAIIECKNLKQMDFGGGADPFCKIQFFINDKKVAKKKTEVKKETLNPYFNDTFNFEVRPDQLNKCHFFITVYDYDLIGSCDPIGKVAVGANQTGKGLQHWQEMVRSPKRPIAQWHTLRDPEEFKMSKED